MDGLNKRKIEGFGSSLARRVEVHEEIGSTQERARELIRTDPNVSHGTLVVSKVQRGGWGRLKRRWDSPKGGLWMSLILRPRIPASLAARITQAAAVGVAKALRGLGVGVRIKWPNDLLVGDRKICGILAESGFERGESFVILGIGLNANLDPGGLGGMGYEVATLRSELGHDVDLSNVLEAILRSLETELDRIDDFAAILQDWKSLDCTLGRQVRVHRSGKILEGKAVDLSPEGALILCTNDGLIEVFEGDVAYLRF